MTILLALLYMSAIIFVGTFLFVMVDVLEPNARLAFVFKCALLAAGGSAIGATIPFRSGDGSLNIRPQCSLGLERFLRQPSRPRPPRPVAKSGDGRHRLQTAPKSTSAGSQPPAARAAFVVFSGRLLELEHETASHRHLPCAATYSLGTSSGRRRQSHYTGLSCSHGRTIV
jgi:hypothetical protein